MSSNRISRTVRAPRAAVYRACSEPAELVRWRFPLDMTARLLGADGARYRMTLGYGDGRADTFDSTFVARVPNEKVVERIRFDAPDRAGEMTVTTELRDADGGTDVTMRFENLPASIRPEDNAEGTRQALVRLAELVEVRANIDRRLGAIERDFGVEIFHACESGSRAWDFASPDSDYDVRFLYRHPRDWYLSLSEPRDVIETPIEGVYDVNGWELRKALRLALKGNPVLFEWLMSPIRYLERPLAAGFREVAFSVFDPVKAYRHYLSMARGQRRTYLLGETVRQKKYFYAVRPLLACQYLLAHRSLVPMRFFDLMDAAAPPAEVRDTLVEMLRTKRQASEAAEAQRLPVLDRWIEQSLDALEARAPEPVTMVDRAPLERFFRSAIGA
ncbi:nucleotidyltransferase domain-containing protein [Reyranella sp.]|uniref:DNA polymerase beta superfamily protein n=1 Tax=Reyranella sp. TaxID=1929291 RepID=UPI0025FE780F|nr:nucleotidyltransferase domain-containing protein [Reyranella sp.]